MTTFQLLAGTGGTGSFYGQSGISGQFVEFDPTIRLMTKGIEDMTLQQQGLFLAEVRDKIMMPSIKKTFQVEGDQRPKKWIPLSAHTIERREKAGFASGPILQRSGKLFRAAKMKARWSIVGHRGKEAIMEYGNFKQPVSMYAIIHQAGYESSSARGTGYAKRIPARPFAVLLEQDEKAIMKLLEKHSDRRWQKVMPKAKKGA